MAPGRVVEKISHQILGTGFSSLQDLLIWDKTEEKDSGMTSKISFNFLVSVFYFSLKKNNNYCHLFIVK